MKAGPLGADGTPRRPVVALGPALSPPVGDVFALRAFASAGRDDVRLTRLKDLDEPMAPAAAARLAGVYFRLAQR